MTTLVLSWPDKALSSNARRHWSKVAQAKRKYRIEAEAWTLFHGAGVSPNAVLQFTFHPPDRRKRDAHNMPHMMKAAIDGIADAMGCDDNNFQCIFPSQFAEPVKGGKVVVEIKRLAAGECEPATTPDIGDPNV